MRDVSSVDREGPLSLSLSLSLILTSLQDPSLPGSAGRQRRARHKALSCRGEVRGLRRDQEEPTISLLAPANVR